MITKIVTNVVGGAISMVALYVVAKLAYKAGSDMSNMENRYKTMCEKTAMMEKKLSENERLNEGKKGALDESKSDEETELIPEEAMKPSRKGGILNLLKGMVGGGKVSVLKDIFSDPEGHKMEACINGDAVDIRIQKR